jgi:hypothetical protein
MEYLYEAAMGESWRERETILISLWVYVLGWRIDDSNRWIGRAFAFLLLDTVQDLFASDWSAWDRQDLDSYGKHWLIRMTDGSKLMKISLKCMRDCLGWFSVQIVERCAADKSTELKEVELAKKLSELASSVEKSLPALEVSEPPTTLTNIGLLTAEHAILKMKLVSCATANGMPVNLTSCVQAWQQHQTELVEHEFANIIDKDLIRYKDLLYDLAATVHKIGRDAFENSQADLALHWLDKGRDIASRAADWDSCEEIRRLKLDILQILGEKAKILYLMLSS